MITVSVLYPRTDISRFDYEYYLGKHIPMVRALWMDKGLERVELLRGDTTLDGSPISYELLGFLTFTSPEAMKAALAESGGQVLGDIPNFTNVSPSIQVNVPVGE